MISPFVRQTALPGAGPSGIRLGRYKEKKVKVAALLAEEAANQEFDSSRSRTAVPAKEEKKVETIEHTFRADPDPLDLSDSFPVISMIGE
jgi:hypothetical protein